MGLKGDNSLILSQTREVSKQSAVERLILQYCFRSRISRKVGSQVQHFGGFVMRGMISGEKVLVCPIICWLVAFVAELSPYVS